jgi:acetylornithine deacetylase/succinyl-diaminopimelate desuccinylase-like protein
VCLLHEDFAAELPVWGRLPASGDAAAPTHVVFVGGAVRDLTPAEAEAAEALKLPAMRMVSRAYHDSLFIAQQFPTAMVFIPCLGGFSHRPDEFASDQDMHNGVAVLALTLARLSLQ